jgi:2',3'-cyclic-nucleotide 2'-phosphodiesterase (5'-nucleotidase family)
MTVAAGDLVGASPLLSALYHDEPTIEAMNLLGVKLTSVGNHEFAVLKRRGVKAIVVLLHQGGF